MAEIALDTFPNARTVFRELGTADQQPVLLLIRGRAGTGKSFLLNAVRTHLRDRRIPVVEFTADTVEDAVPDRAVLVADNVHRYSDAELRALCAAIETGQRSLVLTTQPRPHDTRLRALADAVARNGRTVDLRALGSAHITPFARELGVSVSQPLALRIHQLTAGIPGGVVAALTGAHAASLRTCETAVDEAVTAWTRSLLEAVEPELLETLVIAATGTGLDATELTEVLGVDTATAHELIDRARAGALVTDADLLLAPAVGPLRTLLGDRRYVDVQRRLLAARLDAGLLRDRTALILAESGVVDARLADFLCRTAEKSDEPTRCYAAAAAAGAPVESIAVRWAESAARAGDTDTALRLAQPLLTAENIAPTELVAAVRICAGVLTRRGLVSRAAGLYNWLGPERIGADWAPAAMVLTLAGDQAGAARMSASAPHWPPTEADAGARLIASALDESLDPHGTGTAAAISALIQAGNTGDDRYLPCSAVAITTLLCLGSGEPRRAGDALRRAAGIGGRQLAVLTAWTALLGGDERRAASTLAEIDIAALAPRDQLLAHALTVGLARRSGDHAVLARAWQAACPLFDELEADLLSLLPIGELWLAGIRLRDVRRIEPLADAAMALVRKLGRAPAWTNSFHWYGVQAALAAESPSALLPHAHALRMAAESGDRQATVLADAGRTWVLVLRGQVAAADVQAAVSALAELGLTWDAARLASEAALATGDSTTATALLKLARSVRAQAQPVEPPPTAPLPPPAGSVPLTSESGALSDREREVAELVLLGLTYREIGARLYISAKTVEHHVARIRRRLGARSRSELLSMLRAMGHGQLLV